MSKKIWKKKFEKKFLVRENPSGKSFMLDQFLPILIRKLARLFASIANNTK